MAGDLFGGDAPDQRDSGANGPAPLAERLRPRTLADVVGQEHLTGPEGAIGRMVAAGQLSSIILWGPPGTGKTTIARLLAEAVGMRFRSEEHTSELQSLMRISYAVFCLKKKIKTIRNTNFHQH